MDTQGQDESISPSVEPLYEPSSAAGVAIHKWWLPILHIESSSPVTSLSQLHQVPLSITTIFTRCIPPSLSLSPSITLSLSLLQHQPFFSPSATSPLNNPIESIPSILTYCDLKVSVNESGEGIMMRSTDNGVWGYVEISLSVDGESESGYSWGFWVVVLLVVVCDTGLRC